MDREDLQYKYLNAFDNAMIELVSGISNFQSLGIEKLWEKDSDQVLAFRRGNYVFVFNFSPVNSYSDYGILAPPGKYRVVLSSDAKQFGGWGNIDEKVEHLTLYDELYSPLGKEWLKLYLPARSAQVLRLVRTRQRKDTTK